MKPEDLPDMLQRLRELLRSRDPSERLQGWEMLFSLSVEEVQPLAEIGIFEDKNGKWDGFAHHDGWSCSGWGLAVALRAQGDDPALKAAAEALVSGKKGTVAAIRAAIPATEDARIRGLLEGRINKLLKGYRRHYARR
ncbi:MAG: hypothetical protein AAFV53_37220 [Myxococcota bacterium]